jgi:hypothetical protein
MVNKQVRSHAALALRAKREARSALLNMARMVDESWALLRAQIVYICVRPLRTQVPLTFLELHSNKCKSLEMLHCNTTIEILESMRM